MSFKFKHKIIWNKGRDIQHIGLIFKAVHFLKFWPWKLILQIKCITQDCFNLHLIIIKTKHLKQQNILVLIEYLWYLNSNKSINIYCPKYSAVFFFLTLYDKHGLQPIYPLFLWAHLGLWFLQRKLSYNIEVQRILNGQFRFSWLL